MSKIVFLLFLLSTYKVVIGQVEFKVTDDDNAVVQSTITAIDGNGNLHILGSTQPDGSFKCTCDAAMRIQAKPLDASHLQSNKIFCNVIGGKIITPKIRYVDNLRTNAFIQETKGNLSTSAYLFFKAGENYKDHDTSFYVQYTTMAYQDIGKKLNIQGITVTYDSLTKAIVPSRNLIDGIRKYQKSKGLSETGILDEATLFTANNNESIFNYKTTLKF